jgi:ribose transport system substrate-binding protein
MKRIAALAIGLVVAGAATAPGAPDRVYKIGFANLTEDPHVTLEATGFTGPDVREGFVLAARGLPVDLVFYDNHRDPRRALANAEAAVAGKVDLFIEYNDDPAANAAVAELLKAAGIPVLAINYPVPGAPLYAADDVAAGRIAGQALAEFGADHWAGERIVGLLVGDWARPDQRLVARARGVREGLSRRLKSLKIVQLEPAEVGRFASANSNAKLLVATMSDPVALVTKNALEEAGRAFDAVIVSHGLDRTIHGGQSDKREIDPYNRGSIVLGSVAFYLDRYGSDVLPLALKMLRGEPVPSRTVTRHRLVTPANVWREYPPIDMN